MTFTVEYEREEDGRWLAEVVELEGVLAYGATSDEAIAKAQALALRVLADRLDHGEAASEFVNISFAAAGACSRQRKQSAFSPRFCASFGRLSVNPALTKSFTGPVGPMWSSPFMIVMRLDRRCWLA